MKLFIKTAIIALSAMLAVGCSLVEQSPDKYSPAQVFSSVDGVRMALGGLYAQLPKVGTIYSSEAGKVEYIQRNGLENRFVAGFGPQDESKFGDWAAIRDINYFIDKMNDKAICTIDESLKPNFIGQAKYLRAAKYFSMLVDYGDLPWYEHVIASSDRDGMFKDRQSREEIVNNIIADLDEAYETITNESPDKSTPDKWCALFLKSRVCLFEASYRKYHKLNASTTTGKEFKKTVKDLYELAEKSAKTIMDEGGFSLNTNAGLKGAYRELFYNAELNPNETILGTPTGIDIYGSQNNYFNAIGANLSLVRPFINTYLKLDGTPFTKDANYATKTFAEEFEGRDLRLAQTVRGPQYKMIKTVGGDTPEFAAPDIVNVAAILGYQVIKFTLDKTLDEHEATGNLNTNSTPVYRYAEVLLNYAEAKAELGTITESDWASTIGALRKRAGIAAGSAAVTKLPTEVDEYLKTNFYPNVSDAKILEIRRERACELALEGQRVFDWKRWAIGENFAKLPWTGIHIKALGPVDINGDGVVDVYFSTEDKPAEGQYVNIWMKVFTSGTQEGLHAVPCAADGGYDLQWVMNASKRNWESDGRLYLLPIPEQTVVRYKNNGYKITQNPNYKN